MSYYVQIDVRTRFGSTDRAAEVFRRAAPRMAQLGWRLVGGWRPVVGDVNQLQLFFELDDVANVAQVRDAVRSDPEIVSAFEDLQPLVEGEAITLFERLLPEYEIEGR